MRKNDIILEIPRRGDLPVDVLIYHEPCWLLEAAELVFTLVNQIPPQELSGEGQFCLPAKEVERIRSAACTGIDPEDKRMQFYFQGVPLEGIPERMSCLGVGLLHQTLELGHPDPEDMVQALLEDWKEYAKCGFHIGGIGPFTFNTKENTPKTFCSLAESLERLPIPVSYQMRILEVYSAYEFHLRQVAELLKPVAYALRTLLAPWVKNTEPLLEQWKTFFQNNSPEEFLQNRARAIASNYDTLEIAIGYFFPNLCPAMTYDNAQDNIHAVRCILGLSRVPSMHLSTTLKPEEWELSALRLIANPARLDMLYTMREKPQAVQELAQKLNLNVGSVSRDITNMRNARLLLVDYSGERTVYRTNIVEIDKIIRKVREYLHDI